MLRTLLTDTDTRRDVWIQHHVICVCIQCNNFWLIIPCETLLTIAQRIWSFLSLYTATDDQLIYGGISCSYKTLFRFQLHELRPVYGALFRVSFSTRRGIYWSLFDNFACSCSVFSSFVSLFLFQLVLVRLRVFSSRRIFPSAIQIFISVHSFPFSWLDKLQMAANLDVPVETISKVY